GINRLIQNKYRIKAETQNMEKFFLNADKIIRLNNWYYGPRGDRKLKLSNGSIGVANVKPKYFTDDNGKRVDYDERKFYFRDYDYPITSIDSEENFDLAYAITVHKSQGSDFKNVFLVIPQKQSLLSKE